ncbi:hypothetical protein [Longimicrobium sp.]|uniref:hypothetical protein n=1 Tax=Longimicrobium sp. TaxID=2029185 RepID=UPI002E3044BB|nr:hypothetical protein [Longimicrobium sp.]HEX6041160.1 hypothetical protein [Longimicrobium sp.]
MNYVSSPDVLVGTLLDSTGTVLLTAIAFAVLGLVAGVGLMIVCRRRGMLRRDVPAWAWAARLHFVYVPLLMLTLGGALGSVYGAHRVTRRAIDHGSASMLAYAHGYLPALQASIDATIGARGDGEPVTVETLIARQMQTDHVRNRFARAALYQLNVAIVHHAIDQVNAPEAARRPIEALRHLDLAKVEPRMYEMLPRTLHATANAYYMGKYLFVWMLFAPFLLIPVAEYAAHHVYRRRRNTERCAVPDGAVIPNSRE